MKSAAVIIMRNNNIRKFVIKKDLSLGVMENFV